MHSPFHTIPAALRAPALTLSGALAVLWMLPPGAAAQCGWKPVGSGGVDDTVFAMAAFDYGAGQALYVGGNFETAGGVAVNHIGRWDGWGWAPLGDGLSDPVYALLAFDDGTGPMLYAGGAFDLSGRGTGYIVRWDGTGWRSMPRRNGDVLALAALDDGAGPALYAGGAFTGSQQNDFSTLHIARLMGASWSPLGAGMDDWVTALAAFDDGSGAALYAGGKFRRSGGVRSEHIAKWDGSNWSDLGGGMDQAVSALAVFDDGGGPALFAGGSFGTAGGVSAKGIAKWDGSGWSPVGGGVDRGVVYALQVFDDGTGPALYVGGSFEQAGGESIRGIARWDGKGWSALAGGVHGAAHALGAFDHGPGATLYAGGAFRNPGFDIARWSCAVCYAEFDRNGMLDVRDFLAFLNAWTADEPPADWNGDGQVDAQDVLGFLNDWGAGC
ncbi:MAG TPA: GC-type dockerin domain-anchored protein [Phycisphaerales bacterium]|nr:GC-type dockerin domain-anchored protein [Phycisphaerales bacterium]